MVGVDGNPGAVDFFLDVKGAGVFAEVAAGFFFEQSPGGGVFEVFRWVDIGGADFETFGKFFAAGFSAAGCCFVGGLGGLVSVLLRRVFGGGLGLSQADGVEEVRMLLGVDFLALTTEKLAIEPVDLLLELKDAFTQFPDGYLILGQLFTHAQKESTRSANSGCVVFSDGYELRLSLVPDTIRAACRL